MCACLLKINSAKNFIQIVVPATAVHVSYRNPVITTKRMTVTKTNPAVILKKMEKTAYLLGFGGETPLLSATKE
jgi:hypothetical protein